MTLEQAEAALERARAELEAVALAPVPGQAASQLEAGEAPQASAPRPAPAPPSPATAGRDAESESSPPVEKKEETACETACKAFGSLRRARDAVCRLDAPNGERCSRAAGIVRDAASRVERCGCRS